MLDNTTPASGTGAAGPRKQTIFSSASQSNTSGTFTVGPEPFYVHAFNLNSGDTIAVQAVGGTGSGTAFAAYAPLGVPIVITPGTPQVRLDWPGQYRFVFAGASVTSILCEGYLAVSTEPTIYTMGAGGGGGGGFALTVSDTASIDLNFTGTTAGGTLTAAVKASTDAGNSISGTPTGIFARTIINTTSLLTISGLGNLTTPYSIGATLAVLPYPDLSVQADGLISNSGFGTIIYIVDSPYQICDIFGGERSIDSEGETCVGYSAGAATKGFFKVAIGHSALANATTSASGNFLQDVAVGYQAALSAHKNTSLSAAGVFIGPQAGSGCTYSHATLVGRAAGSGYAGASLCAIGDSAAVSLTGTDNVAVGTNAGTGPLTTNNSVYVGNDAGAGIANGDGIIAIGKNAGTAANGGIGNVNGNMYIGSFAGSHDTHADVIIIASDASAATNSTAAHQIILGKASHTELRTAGSIIAGGAISASDARLKDNVSTLVSVLDKIMQLRPVSYEYDSVALKATGLPYREQDCGKPISGFIAQEIQQIFPEVVDNHIGANGQAYMFIHYDRLVGYAFGALKELSIKNTSLEARLAALEAKVG